MRKFKLIKKYPNSENVGSVWTKRDIDDYYWYTNCYLIPEDVENNPEFFEEIIERPALFVTEDGVEVFKDDNVHWVINGKYGYELRICENHTKSSLLQGDIYKIFSSFEKAQEWILMNKPVLSINDVLQHIRIISGTLDENGLKQLVKSKL